jgi:subtilisin family serine protease
LGCSDTSTPTAPLRYSVSTESRGYIVTLKSSDDALAKSHGAKHVYRYALKGFAANLSPQAIEGLRHNPNVLRIEADGFVSAFEIWNLDRIDQRSLPLDNRYSETRTGRGVTAYIIDTGILLGHTEFEGRASYGMSVIEDGWALYDCNGHGTHVSGTVGGKTYGVAKGVNLVSVRVLDCAGEGTYSGVIAGIDWVTGNAVLPAVANMSLGGSASQAVNDAVRASIARGITYVVSAGNSSADACGYSPASTLEALTVGASDQNDNRAWFSNWGNCVDIFAPGVQVLSAYGGDPLQTSRTAVLNGTSMASPHVAGVAVLYLESHPNLSPSDVEDSVKAYSTKGIVKNALSVNANLLYSGSGVPVVSPPDTVVTPPDTVVTPPTPKCPAGWKKRGLC